MIDKNNHHLRALANSLPKDQVMAMVTFARNELNDEENLYTHARALAREYSDREIERSLTKAEKMVKEEKETIDESRGHTKKEGKYFNPNPKARSDKELRDDIVVALSLEEPMAPYTISQRIGSGSRRAKRLLSEMENDGLVEIDPESGLWRRPQ